MTPLARVLECCAGCGREIDPRKSIAVVEGVSYCGFCKWEHLVGPDIRPCTPPPAGVLPPPSLHEGLVLDRCRQRDQNSAKRFLMALQWMDALPEREPPALPR